MAVIEGVMLRLGFRRVASAWRWRIRGGAVLLAGLLAVLVSSRVPSDGAREAPSLDRVIGGWGASETSSGALEQVSEWLGRRGRAATAGEPRVDRPVSIVAAAPWSST